MWFTTGSFDRVYLETASVGDCKGEVGTRSEASCKWTDGASRPLTAPSTRYN